MMAYNQIKLFFLSFFALIIRYCQRIPIKLNGQLLIPLESHNTLNQLPGTELWDPLTSHCRVHWCVRSYLSNWNAHYKNYRLCCIYDLQFLAQHYIYEYWTISQFWIRIFFAPMKTFTDSISVQLRQKFLQWTFQ